MLGTPQINFFPNEITMKNNLAILENNGSDNKDAQNLQYPINAASTTQQKGTQPINLLWTKKQHILICCYFQVSIISFSYLALIEVFTETRTVTSFIIGTNLSEIIHGATYGILFQMLWSYNQKSESAEGTVFVTENLGDWHSNRGLLFHHLCAATSEADSQNHIFTAQIWCVQP